MTTTDIIESATAAAFNAYEEAYRPVAKHTKTWGESEDEMDRMVWHAAARAAILAALPGICEALRSVAVSTGLAQIKLLEAEEGTDAAEGADRATEAISKAMRAEADRLAAELKEAP